MDKTLSKIGDQVVMEVVRRELAWAQRAGVESVVFTKADFAAGLVARDVGTDVNYILACLSGYNRDMYRAERAVFVNDDGSAIVLKDRHGHGPAPAPSNTQVIGAEGVAWPEYTRTCVPSCDTSTTTDFESVSVSSISSALKSGTLLFGHIWNPNIHVSKTGQGLKTSVATGDVKCDKPVFMYGPEIDGGECKITHLCPPEMDERTLKVWLDKYARALPSFREPPIAHPPLPTAYHASIKFQAKAGEPCAHEWVNAGFTTIKMVCRKCDEEQK